MNDVQDIPALMQGIGDDAKAALRVLSTAPTEAKDKALVSAAASLRRRQNEIVSENAKDMSAGEDKGLSGAMLDRLVLNEERIDGMAKGLEDIAALADPVGTILEERTRPNGLLIQRKRVPLGVIGVIYESRPNVTADAAALCLKAGNAAILRGGSESFHSSRAIMESIREGLAEAGLPEACVQLVPTTDRAAVGEMLTMAGTVDVIVPRGGKSLIERVSAESKVPLFKHLDGICHTYLNSGADPELARNIVVNAKMRRTGICGATETVLVDRDVASSLLPGVLDGLMDAGLSLIHI